MISLGPADAARRIGFTFWRLTNVVYCLTDCADSISLRPDSQPSLNHFMNLQRTSSSGISMENSSSIAMTTSTASRLSSPRSPVKLDSAST